MLSCIFIYVTHFVDAIEILNPADVGFVMNFKLDAVTSRHCTLLNVAFLFYIFCPIEIDNASIITFISIFI